MYIVSLFIEGDCYEQEKTSQSENHSPLSSVLVGTQNRMERKVIVDLALKVGVNEYRFVVYDITDDGKILWNSSKYITPCEDIVKLANSFIRQKSDILSNSMLSNAAQAILLRS